MILIDSPDWHVDQQPRHLQMMSIHLATTVTLRLWLDLLVEYAEQYEDDIDGELLTLAHLISTELVRRDADPHEAIDHLDS
jgi:hypothetical protein